MALNSDTAAQITPEQIQLVEIIEKEIDDWLSRKYSGAEKAEGSFIFGDASRLASEKVMKELSERCRKAGWGHVQITGDIVSELESVVSGLHVHVKLAKR